MTTLGFFICAHDGISCHYAGAGTAASGYLKGIPVLRKILARQGMKLSAYAITGKYSNPIYGFNEKLLLQARTSTAANYFQSRRNEDKKAIETFGKIHIKRLSFIQQNSSF